MELTNEEAAVLRYFGVYNVGDWRYEHICQCNEVKPETLWDRGFVGKTGPGLTQRFITESGRLALAEWEAKQKTT